MNELVEKIMAAIDREIDETGACEEARMREILDEYLGEKREAVG